MAAAARAGYRGRQFLRAMLPRIRPEERASIQPYLPGQLRDLFESLPAAEQRHGIDVFDALRAGGHSDPDLLTAGLLHDCGKGRVRVWHRVAFVVLAAAGPGLPRRIASSEGPGWRRAFYRMLRHPQLGAALVEDAGGSARTAALVGGRGEADTDPELAALMAADEVS